MRGFEGGRFQVMGVSFGFFWFFFTSARPGQEPLAMIDQLDHLDFPRAGAEPAHFPALVALPRVDFDVLQGQLQGRANESRGAGGRRGRWGRIVFFSSGFYTFLAKLGFFL